MTTPYDEINYPDAAFAQSHPDRLAMLAHLMGMTPAPVPQARVLELGCAAGANLIPMACQYPDATFVGIDYAETQIAQARDTAAALRLENMRFEALNFLDVNHDTLGEFDYIIAHGIYSWVPQAVQQAMLTIFKRHLAPQGVGYISYNVLPGWRMYGIGREAMMYRVRGLTDLNERARVAREYLSGIARIERDIQSTNAWARFQKAYDILLKAQMDYLDAKPNNVFVHDELEFNNEALYFWQFMERFEAAGLQFLSESVLPVSLPSNLGDGIQDFLGKHCTNIIELEQTLDFLRNRTFRQTLLVHDDVAVDRRLKLDRLPALYLTSKMQRTPAEGTDGGSVTYIVVDEELKFTTGDPLTIHVFDQLIRTYPREQRLAELVLSAREANYALQIPPRSAEEDAASIAATLLQAFGRSYSMLEMRASPAPMVTEVSERPIASAYARFQAIGGFDVTNQRHEVVTLDRVTRFVISRLDGTHDVAMLARALGQEVVIPRKMNDSGPELRHEVEAVLKYLARTALLVG